MGNQISGDGKESEILLVGPKGIVQELEGYFLLVLIGIQGNVSISPGLFKMSELPLFVRCLGRL